MAPTTALLSPAELAYLHNSLSQSPPIRPDGRNITQFRPLIAEADILPNANGSARVRFSDGAEAVVGVKAEIGQSDVVTKRRAEDGLLGDLRAADDEDGEGAHDRSKPGRGKDGWVDVAVDVPGYREDDQLPVFLAQMISEALTSTGNLRQKLWINTRFHWKLYIDILLLSPPTSYPLPLLSLTTHLALLSTRLPRLISEGDEDPLFDDDWEAAAYLYPYQPGSATARVDNPPITLLVATVGDNVLFDPSQDELACAEGVLALSAGQRASDAPSAVKATEGGVMLGIEQSSPVIQLLAVRMIDAPARQTSFGVPNSANPGADGATTAGIIDTESMRQAYDRGSVWTPPRGGIKRDLIAKVIKLVVDPNGVAQDVMDGLKLFVES